MNTIKRKHIFLAVVLLVVGTFVAVKAMAVHAQNSSVVVVDYSGSDLGMPPNTVTMHLDFISHGFVGTGTIQIPISGSPREMKRIIREVLETSIIDPDSNPSFGGPILKKDDTLIFLGGVPEKL